MQDEYLFVHCNWYYCYYHCIYDYQQILNKRAVNELDQNEFHKGLRKAQVIDVRKKWIMIMDILMVRNILSQYLSNDIKD